MRWEAVPGTNIKTVTNKLFSNAQLCWSALLPSRRARPPEDKASLLKPNRSSAASEIVADFKHSGSVEFSWMRNHILARTVEVDEISVSVRDFLLGTSREISMFFEFQIQRKSVEKLRKWGKTVVTCMSDYRLLFGFIDHLYTQLGATCNYSAIANLHTIKIATAHAKSFPACHSLVTASNSGDSSASALKSSLHSLPYRTHSVAPIVFLIIPLHGPSRKHRFDSISIVGRVSVAAGTCLPRRCLEMNVVSMPFASNGCFSGFTFLTLSK
jgi:hypothetical protein